MGIPHGVDHVRSMLNPCFWYRRTAGRFAMAVDTVTTIPSADASTSLSSPEPRPCSEPLRIDHESSDVPPAVAGVLDLGCRDQPAVANQSPEAPL
jgi:hypothetical protein